MSAPSVELENAAVSISAAINRLGKAEERLAEPERTAIALAIGELRSVARRVQNMAKLTAVGR